MIGQNFKQKQSQTASPRQIQLMQLVQLPLMELENRIKEELERNPTLEEAAPAEPDTDEKAEERDEKEKDERNSDYDDDYFQQYLEDDPTSYNQSKKSDEDYAAPGSYTADETSLLQYLDSQISGLELQSHLEILIASQIIGNLDNDGYLQRSLTAIADDLLINYNLDVPVSEIQAVLKRVQTLDPPGIAARDLRECLLLQINHLVDYGDDIEDMQFADIVLAQRILKENFEAFSKKHYEKLQEKLDVDEDDLRDALREILRLNPKPASGLTGAAGGQSARTVVPDFVLSIQDGKLKLQLTARNAPDLKVSDHYQEMLKNFRKEQKESGKLTVAQKQAAGFIRQNIDSASWFIEAIQQRQQTLFSVMHAIMRYQEAFFRSGDVKDLRPMILKDIGEITGLDISTVSRVASSKFVQTDYGIHSLREFFSEGMTNQEGQEVSTTEIKDVLKTIIEEEDKRKPLADGTLQKELAKKGYDIARRTVAKYREQLGMPVARLRKEF
ncbi:RNA polymerase factor sigma-54 [Neolewinella antarctica]|uniref:RNA polymerase sigma-54 factor n=1 Tax=Neolewinella antarctica TaxID=442734 RepID=A0ABX0XCV4_9BACT|nr:RNA polymerase factor sigma-54 [Neolewinella antarctica]NJC27113.1 RNA polymerase sigma-54 factor [Neolewinella antarctica]